MLDDAFTRVSQDLRQFFISHESGPHPLTICVAGCHRSGTSMVTRILNVCGMDLGNEQSLIPADQQDNPEGYWENLKFIEVNNSILSLKGGDWRQVPDLEDLNAHVTARKITVKAKKLLENELQSKCRGWKDPRNSLTIAFWLGLVPDLKVLLCLRNPFDVAASLSQGTLNRDFSYPEALALWTKYNANVIAQVPIQNLVITDYDAYFTDPRAEIRSVLNQLNMKETQADIDRAIYTVKPFLRHYHTDTAQVSVQELNHIQSLYQYLLHKRHQALSV